ncbi:MAG TPA: molybdopterin cofactor-binding domain-containing protein [Xanthobacteraceae bacterium]|nr:molybdopterin cofactor-binding domain-containing protein [Xanthobacteraceae bacterium]
MSAKPLPKSLVDNPRLDQWIAFEPDRRVRLMVGKVELGQGVLTALAQIAAEELDVRPERLRVVSGDSERAPNEWYTAGSLSIEVSGASIRLAGAEIRRLFLEQIAADLRCDPAEISVVDGRFLRGQADTGLDYWQLAPKVDLARAATGEAAVKHASEMRVVGRSLARLDLPEKVAGAPFIHDLAPADALHARVLRRPNPGAHLVFFDEAAVRRAGKDVQIVRDGDFVAFVCASESAAKVALAAVERTAKWQGGVQPVEDAGSPQRLRAEPTIDQVTEFGAATEKKVARVHEAVYSKPFIAHASLAPSCAVARFADGRLEVITHAQGSYPLRTALSQWLRLAPEKITVRHHQGAGCYGHNGADDAAADAALIATHLPGRAIRVQWSREDELSASPFGPAMAVKLRAELDADSRPVDWTIEIWSGIHGQRPGMNGLNLLPADALSDPPPPPKPRDIGETGGGGATRNAQALYDLPRQRVVHHLIANPAVRTSALRSLGAFANVFAIESFMDELAVLADADPVAYRLSLLSDPRARRVIETATRMSGWPGKIGEATAQGLGFARYKNRSGYAAVVVEARVDEAVRLSRVWCAVDGGLIINPDGAANQIEGGIIQAASWALKEEARFSGGRVASTTWDDYPILRFSEVPEIEIKLIEVQGEPALGLGEVAQGPTAAAIGNAVARALGARIRDLPLTREHIAQALLAS